MKRRSLSLVFLLCLISRSEGQTSSITASLSDPSGQTFNNGTCLVQFVPAFGTPGPFTQSGISFNQQPSCSIDGSGNLSTIITRNDFIQPSKSQWQFTACPNADSACTNVTTSITSGSVDLSSTFNSIIPLVNVNAGKMPRAYKDSEAILTPNQGGMYFRTIDNILRIWNGTTWISVGNGTTITINGTSCIVGSSCTIIGPTINGMLCSLNSPCTITAVPSGACGGDLSNTYPNCTVSKVDGVSYPSGPSTNTVAVITAPNTATYEQIPNTVLANASTSVNGQTCTLGGNCTITSNPTGTTAIRFASGNGCITNAILNDSCSTTVTFSPSFIDANYLAVCQIVTQLQGGAMFVSGSGSRTSSTLVLQTQNAGANNAASQYTYNCWAWHP